MKRKCKKKIRNNERFGHKNVVTTLYDSAFKFLNIVCLLCLVT